MCWYRALGIGVQIGKHLYWGTGMVVSEPRITLIFERWAVMGLFGGVLR